MSTEGGNEFLQLMRAELAGALSQLEIRLIDRFASKADYEADLKTVNLRLDEHGKAIRSLIGWRNRTLGALALVGFVLPLLAAISWHVWG